MYIVSESTVELVCDRKIAGVKVVGRARILRRISGMKTKLLPFPALDFSEG